jgi:hypothetical protein
MKLKINYEKLIRLKPFELGEMINSKGQVITFLEHPFLGDSSEVIVVCKELKIAEYSQFFEIDDMEYENSDYEPIFVDGELKYKYELT